MRRLYDAGVEFLIIGGQAEVLMGSPRVTYDTDLCYRRTPDNLDRLATVLRSLDVKLRLGDGTTLPFLIDAKTLTLGSNFILSTNLGEDLDLLGWVEPIGGFDDLLGSAETYPVDERMTLRTIALEDLKRVKQHIRRDKDGESLQQLLAIRARRQA